MKRIISLLLMFTLLFAPVVFAEVDLDADEVNQHMAEMNNNITSDIVQNDNNMINHINEQQQEYSETKNNNGTLKTVFIIVLSIIIIIAIVFMIKSIL